LAAAAVSALANALFSGLAALLVPYESTSLVWILFVLGLLLLFSAAMNLAVNLLATIAFATLLWNLYKDVSSGESPPIAPADAYPTTFRLLPFALTRTRLLAGLVAGALLATTVGALSLRGVAVEDDAEVTAHRGASAAAPENTLAAVRQAIKDRADWVEIDVQETADGEVVVFHDSDFKKAAGVDLKIWDATLDDLRTIDVGRRFGPQFAGQRVPTLDQVLELCKDRVGVNIELKYYGHDQRLEQRVADIVEAHDMQSQIVIMSLKKEAVRKMKALRPGWRVGLLAAVAIGDATRFEADFLAVNVKLARPDFIHAAHRRGKQVHVWTVNDAVTMSAMLSRGADNLITDDPALARSVLEQRRRLSPVERLFIAVAGVVAPAPPASADES
jgi:glycerophosphoryl diester phosphodiesterase